MNDNLKPKLVWIQGRCYRTNDNTTDIASLEEHISYENDTPYDEIDETDDDGEYEIVMVDNNRYLSKIRVPVHYFGKIIGKKGANVSRIAKDTKTDIKIPRHGVANDISIFGPSIYNVKAAIRKINFNVMEARMKQRPTHFISAPMNGMNIVENFEKFKEQVLRECSKIEESLFIKSSKLHITLTVMCLMDNDERLSASKLLKEAKEKCIMPLIKDHLPLKIKLKGLSIMNDDPSKIKVLYGCVEEVNAPTGLLQRMVDEVFKYFSKSGLLNDKHNRESVNMHVTLLNSKYKARQEQAEGTAIKYRPFDGSEILSKFSDYDFGVMELTNIHLSQCNTTDPDGYYQSTCVISCDNRQKPPVKKNSPGIAGGAITNIYQNSLREKRG